MDGFVARRPQRTSLGEISSKKTTTIGNLRSIENRPEVLSNTRQNTRPLTSANNANKLKQNISESLAAIDKNSKPSHRQERKSLNY